MNTVSRLLCAVLVCCLSSITLHCGGGGGAGGGNNGPVLHKYVDAVNGDDVNNDGTSDRPYRTITKGLGAASVSYMVIVRPGVYNSALGELFPLLIGDTVTILGDVDYKGNGAQPTIIQGAGTYTSAALGANYLVTVVLGRNSAIKGVQIASGAEVGIVSEYDASSAVISNNTITGNQYGVITAGSAGPRVQENVISNNDYAGVETLGSSVPTLAANIISNNGIGIFALAQSQPRIGTTTEPGENTIAGNTNCDLYNAGSSQLYAIGNVWDENAALFAVASSCVNGANIANSGSGSVIYQPAPVGQTPIFPSSTKIEAELPARGSVINTATPHFTWTPTGNTHVMVGLFRKLISIKNNSIANPEDIVWVWHSGLGTGLEGDIQFQDGIRVVNGDVFHAAPYRPLDRGKTYYWAVWAWDRTGVIITHSSLEFYFTVSN